MKRTATLPIAIFAFAAATPMAFLICAAAIGGAWPLAAAMYMGLFAMGLDQIVPLFSSDTPDPAELPGSDILLTALALGHLIALPVLVSAIAGDSGLNIGQRVPLFLGACLWFGQVAMSVAHELIHRGNRWHFRLGVLVLSSLLFGHHVSAHRLVHHVYAATADDPNTARMGEGFYRFALRAWIGSFRRGLQAETARHRRGHIHPYYAYVALASASLCAGFVIAGPLGVLVWAGLAFHAQMQLLLSDYVQHYGLLRAASKDGRPEPVTDRHSWNAPHWITGAMMLNAPRHSDHHAHPARPYPSLRLPAAGAAPMLPWPLPLACTLALIPPLWKRLIGPHLAPWR